MTEINPEENTTGLWSLVIKTSKVLGVLVFFAVVVYGFHQYIKTTIRSVVQDETFVRKLAAQIRPSITFDENGSILVDQGGMQFIDSIKVALGKSNRPSQITISPKQHLVYPPFLESVTLNRFRISSKRGKGFDWIFELDVRSYSEDSTDMFRLEIIK